MVYIAMPERGGCLLSLIKKISSCKHCLIRNLFPFASSRKQRNKQKMDEDAIKRMKEALSRGPARGAETRGVSEQNTPRCGRGMCVRHPGWVWCQQRLRCHGGILCGEWWRCIRSPRKKKWSDTQYWSSITHSLGHSVAAELSARLGALMEVPGRAEGRGFLPEPCHQFTNLRWQEHRSVQGMGEWYPIFLGCLKVTAKVFFLFPNISHTNALVPPFPFSYMSISLMRSCVQKLKPQDKGEIACILLPSPPSFPQPTRRKVSLLRSTEWGEKGGERGREFESQVLQTMVALRESASKLELNEKI